MSTIHARFQLFREVDLAELIGAIDVYVIWDARPGARPTYIGQDNILKRFADHVSRDGRRFAHPCNGYVVIISGSTRNAPKEESKAVERLLLDVAEDTDRLSMAIQGLFRSRLNKCFQEDGDLQLSSLQL